MRNLFKKLLCTVTCMTLLLTVGCVNAPDSKTEDNKNTSKVESTEKDKTQQSDSKTNTTLNAKDAVALDLKGKKPIVTIEMEDGSKIKAELYPDIAPKTVSNFVYLIQNKFYDGLIFHRVIAEFMIQGGDPKGNGTGGPGYNIPGEFTSNNFKNDLKHERGVLSMARSQAPDSAGSQFFIMTQTSPHLDGNYASFGKVIEGLDVVDKIANVEKDKNDKPVKDQKMKQVTVEIK